MYLAPDVGASPTQQSLSAYEYVDPSFVVGHSLGGTAATLFIKSRNTWMAGSTAPKLVTFGAAPTHYNGDFAAGEIACKGSFLSGTEVGPSGRDAMTLNDLDVGYFPAVAGSECEVSASGKLTLTQDAWNTYASYVAEPCNSYSPGSVRFFHKFDPISSIGTISGGSFDHATEYAIMIWDEVTPVCTMDAADNCDIDVNTDSTINYGTYTIDPEDIKDYMCVAHTTKPMATVTGCIDKLSSYATMMNPWPCAGMITGAFMKYLPFLNDMTKATMGYFFVAFEDYSGCVMDWYATVSSHYSAAVLDQPETYGVAFTFTWTHSSYGVYPLCLTTSDDGSVSASETMTESGLELLSGCVSNQAEDDCYDETVSGCTVGDEVCVQLCICEAGAAGLLSYCSDFDNNACAETYDPDTNAWEGSGSGM
jgi:hypothetical protein